MKDFTPALPYLFFPTLCGDFTHMYSDFVVGCSMTPAAQKLCRDIAEAEGRNQSRDYYKPLPPYLTDPTETLRMLVALAEWGVVHLLKVYIGEEWVCGVSVKDFLLRVHRYNFKAATPEHAIAEAYRAMLLAKKGEKV